VEKRCSQDQFSIEPAIAEMVGQKQRNSADLLAVGHNVIEHAHIGNDPSARLFGRNVDMIRFHGEFNNSSGGELPEDFKA